MGEIPSTTRWPGMLIRVTAFKDGRVSNSVISVASNWSPAMPWGYLEDGLVNSKTRSCSSTSSRVRQCIHRQTGGFGAVPPEYYVSIVID